MPYVEIISSDGEFIVKPMSDETADHYMQQGGDPISIEDAVYEAWVAHTKQHRVFNALWIALQNEQHAKREREQLRDAAYRIDGERQRAVMSPKKKRAK